MAQVKLFDEAAGKALMQGIINRFTTPAQVEQKITAKGYQTAAQVSSAVTNGINDAAGNGLAASGGKLSVKSNSNAIDVTASGIELVTNQGLVVSSGDGLEVAVGAGLAFDNNDKLTLNCGDGLILNGQKIELNPDTDKGLDCENGKLRVRIGNGLKFGETKEVTVDTDTIATQAFVTGKGYQTSAQVESAITAKGYQTSAQVSSAISSAINVLTKDADQNFDTFKEISDWISNHGKDAAGMLTSINDLEDVTEALQASIDDVSGSIPTKVSELTNDSGYQTAAQVNTAITGKGYQTAAQVETAITGKGYQTAAQVNTAIDENVAPILEVIGEQQTWIEEHSVITATEVEALWDTLA